MVVNQMKVLQSVQSLSTRMPHRLPPLPSPRDLIKIYKLRARKQLSQNFLLDARLTDRLVKAAGAIFDGDVCEVGPGPGTITRSILRRNPGRVLVIEKDDRFLPMLDMLKDASRGQMQIIIGDVLLLEMSKIFRKELCVPWESRPPNIHLIGNLPFNVSTPLIIRWLRDISLKQNAWQCGRVKMTLTFQKEVAERIVALANEDQRCRLSVMCQNWCDVKHAFTISGSAFVPPPDVDVGVVTFQPKVKPLILDDFSLVEKVVRQMFTFRQKKCVRCAETLFPSYINKKLSSEMLVLADINPETRPYQLTNEEFQRIVSAYKVICNNDHKLLKFDPKGKIDQQFWLKDEEEEEASLQYVSSSGNIESSGNTGLDTLSDNPSQL